MAYDPNNIGKYYHCKKRFLESFISVGEKEGQTIPFSNRYWDGGNNHTLHTGETTFLLGSYIAFLATEYRLFTDSGIDTSQTIKELFYALNTINRLDFIGETFTEIPNSNPTLNYQPDLNGYFVRNDINDTFFLQNNPRIVEGYPSAANTNVVGYITNSGQTTYINGLRPSDKNPMSRDHIFRILWGLLLTTKLLDDGVNINLKFMDGLTDFKDECRAIHKRIKDFLTSNGNKIVKPDGSFPIGASMNFDMPAINRSSSNINGIPSSYWSPNIWGGYLWTGWMNGRMSVEKQNLSGNWYRTWRRSWKYGYESYFLYYGRLVYNWPLGPWYTNRRDRERKLKRTTEFYLNVFPCSGNFNHSNSDFSFFGWAMPDRSERSIKDGYFGMHETGNFNSLDFLLMHNLYYLNNFQELGAFQTFDNQSCTLDCSYIDKNVMNDEIQRVQSYINGQILNDYINCYVSCIGRCFANCNNQLNDCKNRVLNNYNNCRNQCNNQRWWRRGICRTRCWIVYQARRIACTASSLWCKARCAVNCLSSCYTTLKNQRKYYKYKLDEMSKIC